MKKVCIITSEESFMTNFGASLQGFALYHTIKNAGYDVNIQRYLGGVLNFENQKRQSKIKRVLNYSWSEIYLKCLFRIGKAIHKRDIIKQRQLFKSFQDDYMSFYPGERKNWVTIRNDIPDADIYVCGSDQIWNPFFKGGYNDPGYFLNFAVRGKKIAYAPSFGVSDIPPTSQKDLKELLHDFSAISVREKAGADIIKKYAGLDVPVVLDPTLLVPESTWRKIEKRPAGIPDEYILCYRFGNSLEVNNQIKEISKLLALPIITLPLSGISYLNREERRVFEAGPREFIDLIDHATLVCTDSFHASVFSILMETPFVTFLRGEAANKGEGMNSRVTHLLGMLQLETRISSHIELSDKDRLLQCNFETAKLILSMKREESLNWLIHALKGDEE